MSEHEGGNGNGHEDMVVAEVVELDHTSLHEAVNLWISRKYGNKRRLTNVEWEIVRQDSDDHIPIKGIFAVCTLEVRP